MLAQEVSFDPSVDDTNLTMVTDAPVVNETAAALARGDITPDQVDPAEALLTEEDLLDAQTAGANDMASCGIELQNHIFNFNSLSL